MDYEIRPGTPQDADQITEVIVDAFEVDLDSPRLPMWRGMCRSVPHEFRVMTLDGRLVAALRVHEAWIQVGKCTVRKGDSGEVSVRTELQGRGLGSALMKDALEWMRADGYHMSRLGGLMSFYSRFGYEPFLRRFVEFSVDEMQGGKRSISPH